MADQVDRLMKEHEGKLCQSIGAKLNTGFIKEYEDVLSGMQSTLFRATKACVVESEDPLAKDRMEAKVRSLCEVCLFGSLKAGGILYCCMVLPFGFSLTSFRWPGTSPPALSFVNPTTVLTLTQSASHRVYLVTGALHRTVAAASRSRMSLRLLMKHCAAQ
jgi:hypothetical protein